MCGNHSFVSVGLDIDVDKAKEDLGWDGFTEKESAAILRWYNQTVEPSIFWAS